MDGTGSATANMTTKTGHQGAHEPSPVGMILVYVPIMALVGCASIAFLYRIWSDFINNQRLKFAIRHDCKISFHRPNRPKAWLNRHLLYAPLFERRHNREFRICRGHINMGNIPTRLETLLIICYIALNVLICVAVVDWSQSISQSLRCLIGTTGTLAIVNLVPLVITAGRNNPLILVLRVPFDAFNLVHRWLGRIVVAEAVAHTMAVLVRVGGWDTIPDHLFHNPIFTYGFVAIIAFVVILFQSLSPFRHAFYEFFLHFHIILVTASFVALWYHLHKFVQKWIFLGAIITWAMDRLLRLAIVAWRNCGKSLTSATIQLLPGDVARVDVTVIRPWKFEAGQYMYLYIPSLGLWTSHPFSAAWESADKPHGSFSAMDSERSSNSSSRSILSDTARDTQRTVSFLIRKRDGFTKKMLKSVGLKVGLQRRVLVLAEGPFAGGIGITHSISYLRELVDEFAKGSVATRRITLLWVVRSIDHLQWVQPWMTSILNHPVVQGSVAFSNASTTLDSRSPYSIYNDTCFERTLSLSVNVHLTTYYSSSNTDTFNIDPLPARYSSLICNQEKRSNPYNDEITPVTPAHTKTFPKDSPSFSRPYPYPHPHLTELSSPTGSSSSSTLNKTIDQDYYQHDDEKTHILTPSLSNVATKITTTTNTNTNTSTRNQLFQDWTQLSTPTAPVTINLGKPFFRQVLEREMAQQIGAMAVSVCGPGGMGDEVRKAVREVQGKKTVEFFEESFSW
uniref:ferric-chelate reductase (NADPH) n=1 Tax=Talaromyces marneffei PM1 TaxID=1077442 RepID=A0A093VE74_TALMA